MERVPMLNAVIPEDPRMPERSPQPLPGRDPNELLPVDEPAEPGIPLEEPPTDDNPCEMPNIDPPPAREKN